MLPLSFPIITGEKLWYKLLNAGMLAIGGVLLLFLVVPAWRHYVIVPGIMLVVGFALYLLAPTSAIFLLHETVQLAPDGVWLKKRFIKISDLRSIKVSFNGYKGQRNGRSSLNNGGDNYLVVVLGSGEHPPPIQFLVSSYNHRQQLVLILKIWQQVGIQVVADGLDLA